MWASLVWLFAPTGIASLAALIALAARLSAGRPPLEYEPRRRVPWGGGGVLLLFLVLVALESALQFAWIGNSTDSVRDAAMTPEGSFAILSAAVASRLGWSVLALGALKLLGASSRDLGVRFDRLPRDLAIGLTTVLIVLPPLILLQRLLTAWMPYQHPLLELVQSNSDRRMLSLMAASAVLAAPLAEELLFRLILQGWLERREPRWRRRLGDAGPPRGWLSIWISALLFAAMHLGQGPAPIPLFFLGVALGYLYHRTHRVVPCIVAHALFNAFGVALFVLTLTDS